VVGGGLKHRRRGFERLPAHSALTVRAAIFDKITNEHVRDVARTLNRSALVRASGSRKGDRRKADQGSAFIRRAPVDEAGG